MRKFADIHVHPAMKPYSNSFTADENIGNRNNNSQDSGNKSSIWYYYPPCDDEKKLAKLGISRYSQSDLTCLKKGNVRLVFSSLYPIEREFFDNKLGTGAISDEILHFFTKINRNRIDAVQSTTDYFKDLQAEYDFLCELDNKQVKVDGEYCTYKIAANFQDAERDLNDETDDVIVVINTIEGGHALCSGIQTAGNPCNPDIVTENIYRIKHWKHRPLFITLAHHFYNGLCGHEQSLDKIGLIVDQSPGMGSYFSTAGIRALETLLDNEDGKRILIDIKHLAHNTSRAQYYNFVNEKFGTDNIPLIVSHGAVAGSNKNDFNFNYSPVNFFDDELIKISKSKGIFGIMFDRGRLAGKLKLKTYMPFSSKQAWSGLIWLQAEHIARVLDKAGLQAWNIQCIGSDYDGIINPIKHFITAESFPELGEHMLLHAKTFLSKKNLINDFNKLDAEEIVDKICFSNAYNFLKKTY